MPDTLKAAHSLFISKDRRGCLIALLNLIDAGIEKEEAAKFILENYFDPVKTLLESVYDNNTAALRDYPYIQDREFPAFEELKKIYIPVEDTIDRSKTQFVTFDRASLTFERPRGFTTLPPSMFDDISGYTGLLNEAYDPGFLEWVMERSDCEMILTQRVPVYLYYRDLESFVEKLPIFDLSKVLEPRRLVFLFGPSQAEEYLMRPATYPTSFFLSSPDCDTSNAAALIDKISARRAQRLEEMKRDISSHYGTLQPADIASRIRSGTARITFVTTRFSTAVQYYSRDCVTALKSLGYDARTLIEESDITCLFEDVYLDHFSSFKPDVVVIIDYTRNRYVPDRAVFVCWIQDFLETILSRSAAEATGKLDFVMNQFSSNAEFRSFGFPEKQLVNAPVPVDEAIYKNYPLSDEELNRYSADVCVISNSGDIDGAFEKFMKIFDSHPSYSIVRKVFAKVRSEIYDAVHDERADYHDCKDICRLCADKFSAEGIDLCYDEFKKVFHEFKTGVIANIYKVVPLMWLHERGYDMKIWGRPWPSHSVLKKYAMGVAENGETMSRILNASKISVGMNIAVTFHPRLMESILSGCLYIGNNIPAPHDWSDARGYFEEGRDFLLFYGKKDLYAKIDRYLADETARRAMVEAGSARILAEYTAVHAMEKLMATIEARLSEM